MIPSPKPGRWAWSYTCTMPLGSITVLDHNGGPDRRVVCWLHHIDHIDQVEQTEANARLIAAAPEMLAALYQANGHLQDCHDAGRGDFSMTLAECRAAIAKATGKSDTVTENDATAEETECRRCGEIEPCDRDTGLCASCQGLFNRLPRQGE